MSTRPALSEEVVLRASGRAKPYRFYWCRWCSFEPAARRFRYPLRPGHDTCWYHRHGHIYVGGYRGRDWWHPKKGRQGHGNSR